MQEPAPIAPSSSTSVLSSKSLTGPQHSQLVSFKKWVGGTFFSWDCMTKCIFVLASYLVDIELRIAINLEIIFPGILKALLYILIASNIAIKV